ncbi:MAG: COX15/CtaA family protein [Acidimicrobiaceae bacterium]|nr:COX15/CtaA family protein [Acidimicrobiaceae bacterium]
MAPTAYARLTRFALWALAAIVVTGVSVRLTGSGLGCEDWPACSQDRFVADLEFHALVEFVNRLFTGVVAVAVIGAVLGAWRRRPRRADLAWLSLGLVAGVLAQVGLGALLVLSELDPRFTMGHFLLSMVLLWNASLLDVKARDFEPGDPGRAVELAGDGASRSERRGGKDDQDDAGDTGGTAGTGDTDGTGGTDVVTRLLVWAVMTVAAVLLVSGTLVTGAGPHAGDSRAERLPLLVREVVRVHSVIAIALLVLVIWAWWRMRASGSSEQVRMRRIAELLIVQAAVGYAQYFLGVPVLLVGIHVTLASITWIQIVKAAYAGASPRGRRPPRRHRATVARTAGPLTSDH